MNFRIEPTTANFLFVELYTSVITKNIRWNNGVLEPKKIAFQSDKKEDKMRTEEIFAAGGGELLSGDKSSII